MANTKKYKLNPKWPSYPKASVNGVSFDQDTVVQGEQWEKFLKPMFAGKPALLVPAKENAPVTKPGKETAASRQALRKEPKKKSVGPSEALTVTALKVDAEKKADPPPPKPPVKVLKPEHEKRKEEVEEEEEFEELELTDIRGVGGGRAEQLEDAGYPGVVEVSEADPQEMLDELKEQGARMNLATAKAIIKSAKELLEE